MRAGQGPVATIQGTFAVIYSFQLRPFDEVYRTFPKQPGGHKFHTRACKEPFIFLVCCSLYFQDEGNWVAIDEDQESDWVGEDLKLNTTQLYCHFGDSSFLCWGLLDFHKFLFRSSQRIIQKHLPSQCLSGRGKVCSSVVYHFADGVHRVLNCANNYFSKLLSIFWYLMF